MRAQGGGEHTTTLRLLVSLASSVFSSHLTTAELDEFYK